MRKEPIHRSIKKRLGYSEDEPDEAVYEDWKARLRRVCKPCWELRYCPYGPFVEQSPVLPGEREGQAEHVKYLQSCIETGLIGQVVDLDDVLRQEYEEWLKDEQLLIAQVLYDWMQADHYDTIGKIEDDEERLAALIRNSLPPIHEYRIAFDAGTPRTYSKDDFSPEVWEKILAGVAARKQELRNALKKVRSTSADQLNQLGAKCFRR